MSVTAPDYKQLANAYYLCRDLLDKMVGIAYIPNQDDFKIRVMHEVLDGIKDLHETDAFIRTQELMDGGLITKGGLIDVNNR